MKKDFVISDLIALKGKSFYYDIHNCYSVKAVEFEKDKKHLKVVFEKVQGEWVKDKDPEIIKLCFDNVTSFETSPSFYENNPKDIGEMAYTNKDDFDYDFFITEELSTEQDYFILRFVSDNYVRVFADRIEIETL